MFDAIRYNATEVRTCAEATRHADYMLAEYGEPRTVFYRPGRDRFGRDGVFYVRPPDDAEMLGLVAAGLVVTAYVALPTSR